MPRNSKKIPWWQPQIGRYEYKLVREVLKSNFPNEGRLTTLFEKELSELLKIEHVIAVPNATSAIFLSLKALSIGYGDEVIVPDFTFIATANAVEMTGAKVVLADIDPKTLTIDPQSLKKVISKKTKAVIPVHVSGRGADMDEICRIAKEKKISVVEDAAEAFMSKYKGKYLGTIGLTGCFSLSPAKTITTGQGGFIVTNDKKIYLSIKRLKDQGRPMRGTGGDDIHDSIGYNFKYTDLQAAVGLGQLRYLETRTKRLQKNYSLYKKFLQNVYGVSLFNFTIDEGEVPQWSDAVFDDTKNLDNFLSQNNVDCRRFWLPIHQQKPYREPDSNFPSASRLAKKIMWLPSAYTLTDRDIKKVSVLISKFYKQK